MILLVHTVHHITCVALNTIMHVLFLSLDTIVIMGFYCTMRSLGKCCKAKSKY